MAEGEQDISSSVEQEKIGVEKKPELSFEEKVKSLIEPPEKGKEAVITDESLLRLAKLVLQPRNQKPERLQNFLERGDDWFADGKVSEEEWEILAGVIEENLTRLKATATAQQTQAAPPSEVKIDFQPLVKQIEKGQQALTKAFEGQRLSLDQFLKRSQKQARDLTESLKRLAPEEERERWVVVEYGQEFYTRFTPTLEPRFYTLLPAKERQLFDDRWQLARTAFWKKVNAAAVDKQVENQELQLLKVEQMERLYKIPGVQEALEWYTNEIVNGHTKIKVPRKKEPITILECQDEIEFEEFREAMRQQTLSGFKRLAAKEADAIAWNWMWVSGLIESVDSRYSHGGERHGDLPGVMISDDLRSTLHPQEKFEGKCRSGLEWGAFGKWGVTQMERIKKETNFDKNKDEMRFIAASKPPEFWAAKRTKQAVFDTKGKLKEKGEVMVKAPECYPTTSVGSFWERTKIGDRPLLDYLLKKEEIPWRKVGADPWIGYLVIGLNKAVQLSEYFNPGKLLEERKESEWVNPLLDIFKRLGLESRRDFHNLKVWAVFAAYGGVKDPSNWRLTIPLTTMDREVMVRRLRLPQVGYLDKKEGLDIR